MTDKETITPEDAIKVLQKEEVRKDKECLEKVNKILDEYGRLLEPIITIQGNRITGTIGLKSK